MVEWALAFLAILLVSGVVLGLYKESGVRHIVRSSLSVTFASFLFAFAFLNFFEVSEVSPYSVLLIVIMVPLQTRYQLKTMSARIEEGYFTINRTNFWLTLSIILFFFLLKEMVPFLRSKDLNTQVMFIAGTLFFAFTVVDLIFTKYVEIKSGKKLIERVKA